MNKILLIGGGGREHALAWKLAQSQKVEKIYIAPGNAGTAEVGENVNIKATDFPALIDFAKTNNIDFTVVGPDDPLVLGIVDEFQKAGLKIWGPQKAAAQIEGSKAFSKELMLNNNIPTAKSTTFNNYNEALKYINTSPLPIVIKASGLALGKGVAVCETLDDAQKFLADVMQKKIFGDSGNEVVIEDFLEGMEFSTHAFSDGQNFVMLPPSQDHKRIFDKDKGPNTGGMGTVAPLPWATNEMMDKISSTIVKPALQGLKNIDAKFVGLLYPGLMSTKEGPKVIEFNARFGDPETQSYMRLLKTDLYDILNACAEGKLNEINIEWENKYACCIVLASGGYPGDYKKGLPITGINEANKMDDIIVFHAGTKVESNQLVTNGGRVLGVTAIADDLQTALNKAYQAVKLVNFEGMHYRKDIGKKSLS